jgi:hypothetical protein
MKEKSAVYFINVSLLFLHFCSSPPWWGSLVAEMNTKIFML